MMRRAFLSTVTAVILGGLCGVTGACQGTSPDVTAGGFEYPRPTGENPVGTRYLFLEDPDRLDGYSEDPDDHRWISVVAWYPAAPAPGSEPVPFSDDEFSRSMVDGGFLRSEYLTDVALRPSASFQDAPIATKGAPWPILIFSSSGVMTANVFLFEELASHGYAVFAVGHPYWCEFYFDGQGEMFHFDKNNPYYTSMWEEERAGPTEETKERITRSTDAGEKLELFEELNRLMPTEVADLVLWQEDIEFLLDQLAALNDQEGPYRGALNTGRVGVMGYSKGGALAGQVCATSNRVLAGVNLGGFAFGGLVENDLVKPFMTLEHIEPWCHECPPISLPFFQRSSSDSYLLQIDGANHATFTDLPLLRDYIVPEGVVSPLDGETSAAIINSYLLAFFDTYVKGLPRSPILDQMPSHFDEVRFMKRAGRSASLYGRKRPWPRLSFTVSGG
jgi:hypothetical protein